MSFTSCEMTVTTKLDDRLQSSPAADSIPEKIVPM